MSKKTWLIGAGVVAALFGGSALIRQSNGAGAPSAAGEASSGVRTIKVAHRQDYVPYAYVDDKGKPTGYEVAVLQAIDEKLEDYEFQYTATSDEDLLIGLESGKYDIGVKGAWYTEERAQKFIIPETPIGASVIGFTIRAEDKPKYSNIDDFAKAGAKLVPISPQNAQYNVIQAYNDKNPDYQIQLTESESFQIADAYAWVLEGRYDAFFDIKLSFEKAVQDSTGSYHQYANQLSWFPYKGIPTYPLLYRTEANQDFAEAYEEAIAELDKDGTLAEISQTFFGENVFDFVTE